MSEFKGTKGKASLVSENNVQIDTLPGIVASTWSTYKPDLVEVKVPGESWLDMRARTKVIREEKVVETKANAELIVDAFNVRQQISCDLPELLRQRNEMALALRTVLKQSRDIFLLEDLCDHIEDLLGKVIE